jgi:predicted RNA methylase
VDQLDLNDVHQIILCSVVFDQTQPELCFEKLARIAAQTKQEPLIVSHRWPDGYEKQYEVLVPPFDLLELFAKDLLPEERELLRLSLTVRKEADRASLRDSDFTVSQVLARANWNQLSLFWNELIDEDKNPVEVWKTFLPPKSVEPDRPVPPHKLTETGIGYCVFDLDSSSRGGVETAIETLLLQNHAESSKLGIGVLHDIDPQGKQRFAVYVTRGWNVNDRPSIEWLLETKFDQFHLPSPNEWWGHQDAKVLVELTPERLAELKPKLIEFANAVYDEKHGERRCAAGLAKAIHEAATRTLRSIDLLGEYTSEDDPSIYFEPKRTRILIYPSNKTGDIRSTLVLTVLCKNIEAAAFLLKHQGYNFSKLESQLEGVLIGIGRPRSMWLGSLQPPTRLRIDIEFPSDLSRLDDTLKTFEEVRSLSAEEASERRLITSQGNIFKAISGNDLKDGKVIIYRSSEMIGPSVPYAKLAAALAWTLREIKRNRLDILDLFAGSGAVAKALLSKQQDWRIFCVDYAVTAEQVELDKYSDVIWFLTDVRSVLRQKGSLIERKVDLVCMDPPHSALFDILFGKEPDDQNLLAFVQRRGPWLIVYQGHASQTGRGIALCKLLKGSFENVVLWKIGPEVMIVAGPNIWEDTDFRTVIDRTTRLVERDCSDYDFSVNPPSHC